MSGQANDIFVFVDNEGPCTRNDNAQENTVALAKACGLGEEIGIQFYKNTSNIDDIWGDFHRIPKDRSYSSGHTLKVVLPFYKAMDATEARLYQFARDNVRVVPNIAAVLTTLSRKFNLWQISTSYDFFIKAFCDSVGFDSRRAHCTTVAGFDEIPIIADEKARLREFMREVAAMPVIEYHGKTGEVVAHHLAFYDRFTDFVWEVVYNMPVGEFLRSVHPVGQTQKREALEAICRERCVPMERAMYVGDSQTDVQCVQFLQGQGLTMMFNGKGKVCQLSDIMYIGEDARAIEEVADLFAEGGRQAVIQHYSPRRKAKCGGTLAAVSPSNIEELHERSIKKREEFRGVPIADLT